MRRLMVRVAFVVALLVCVSSASSGTQGRWVIRDLGTLPGSSESEARAINNRGQVIGTSYITSTHGFLWEKGKMRDLGTLVPGGDSSPFAINERGQVVGFAFARQGEWHAFLWQNGRMRDLGTLGGPGSKAWDINERGQVVGVSDMDAETRDEFGLPVTHAFMWQNGRMRDLGTLGGPGSNANAINEKGQVVGTADTKAKDKDGDPVGHAFLWQNGKMRDLGTLGGPGSGAAAINEKGQVVGSADTRAGVRHVFLWENGKMRDLGTLGGHSFARAINEKGQVIGSADTKRRDENGSLASHAFLWQNGNMRDLGTVGGSTSHAAAINEKGQVVGESDLKAGEWDHGKFFPFSMAFILQGVTMRRLGTLGGMESVAKDINDRDQIVGTADTKRSFHAVLWTYKR